MEGGGGAGRGLTGEAARGTAAGSPPRLGLVKEGGLQVPRPSSRAARTPLNKRGAGSGRGGAAGSPPVRDTIEIRPQPGHPRDVGPDASPGTASGLTGLRGRVPRGASPDARPCTWPPPSRPSPGPPSPPLPDQPLAETGRENFAAARASHAGVGGRRQGC
jgi:hypothetical protein